MCNYVLKPLIIKFRNQEMEAFNEVYLVFKKLINFYSKNLGYDDAVQDMMLFLIELFYKINLDLFESDETLSLKKYIAVSIRNQYILLSKSRQKYIPTCNELYDYMGSCEFNNDDRISLSEGMKLLSEKQRAIIEYRYIYDYSDAEIADIFLISRQAVNKIRNKGLSVLKAYYCGLIKNV